MSVKIEYIHEITEGLQKQAELKMQKEVEKATNYYNGYIQGCEDLAKAWRQSLYDQKNKENPSENESGDVKNETTDSDNKKDDLENDSNPEKSNRGGQKRKIDIGKVMALRNAGWSNTKIADEMGLEPQAIANAIWRHKKKEQEEK